MPHPSVVRSPLRPSLARAGARRSATAAARAGSIAAALGASVVAVAVAAPPRVVERTIDDDFHTAALTVGDLDADGRVDVVAAGYYGDVVAWWRNVEGPDGLPQWERRDLAVLNGASSVEVADLDGDGDLDVLAASRLEGTVLFLESRLEQGGGAGELDFEVRTAVSIDESEPWSMDLADLDGDGTLDLAVAFLYRSGVHVYYNPGGDGDDLAAHLQVIPVSGNGVAWVRCTDFDGDGDADLVASTAWDSVDQRLYYWFRNDGRPDGVPPGFADFGPQQVIGGGDALQGAFTAAVVDVDGDGGPDLATMSDWGPSTRGVHWFRRLDDAGEAWTDPAVVDPAFEGSDGTRSLAPVDLNGDGRPDLVGGSSFVEPGLRAWINLGGTFTPLDLAPGFAANGVASADLDGDGRPEVVAGSWQFYTGEIRTFTLCPHCPQDLDGDCRADEGDLDVLLATWGASGPAEAADLDGDGTVGYGDLLWLLARFGPC